MVLLGFCASNKHIDIQHPLCSGTGDIRINEVCPAPEELLSPFLGTSHPECNGEGKVFVPLAEKITAKRILYFSGLLTVMPVSPVKVAAEGR